MESPLQAALEYAEAGWRVIPLRPASKLPATEHGIEEASSDPHVIADWFIFSNYGVGIATGYPGPVVIDFDIKDNPDGMVALRTKLARAGFLQGCGWQVGTPSGGGHLYYDAVQGHDRGFRLRPHLDVQGAGSYVVAPPTRTEAGDYWPLTQRRPARALNTDALRDFLRPPREATQQQSSDRTDFSAAFAHADAEIKNGASRHDKIGWLLRIGCPREQVEEWAERVKPGSSGEVEGWIRWLSRQG